jgi:uncharacterized protein
MRNVPEVRWVLMVLAAAVVSPTAAPQAPRAPLAPEIAAIRAIDNHAHVVRPVADDRDYDALPFELLDPAPPGSPPGPVRLRPDFPGFIGAWKALFRYPYDDASEAHRKEAIALKQRSMQQRGASYPAWVLDQMGVETVLANRVTMGPELTPPRFRWVPYIDALIFPLDNSAAKAANRDYAAFYPPEEKLLRRYMIESGVRALPATLVEYCRTVVTPTLERHKAAGAVAEKMEIAYLRWLDFGPASEADAARIYAEYAKGGPPPTRDYKTVQDYLFAYVAREAGRLGMAIHIHTANGGGNNYDQRGSMPLLLTWAFNEPSLRKTNFVIVHGGFPHTEDTAGLLSKPNVYADTSFWSFMADARQQALMLRPWLTSWPEKVLYGSDATPNTDETSWEETGWVASRTFRDALAIALQGMIDDGEISRARALELARMVLHDNAARLYGFR